jgi:DNA-directed RNA polymerase subunit delta
VRALGLDKYSKEQILEMSLIEIAYELLVQKKQPIVFKELLDEIKKLQNLSDGDVRNTLSQFYTDLNVDGRFTSLGENRWGLKTWYPVDQIEEEVVHTAKPKKKKAKKAVDEDELDELDDEDLDFDDDLDDVDDEEEDDDLLDDVDDDDDLIEEDDLLDDDVDGEEEEELEEDLIEDDDYELDDDEDEDEIDEADDKEKE